MEKFTIRPISKELREIAIKELNEDPKKVEEDIKYIVDWLKMQPHLRPRTGKYLTVSMIRL